MSEHGDRLTPLTGPVWLAAWRRDIDTATATLLAGFEDRFGYPPGRNAIDIPGPRGLAEAARLAELPAPAVSLTVFYRYIGQVVLEDIGNAYFVHSAAHVLRDLTERGPIALGEPGPGTVFASDGGGILFAITSDGAVHRSVAASRDSAFHRVADDLQDFLDQLRNAVIRFAETGQPGRL